MPNAGRLLFLRGNSSAGSASELASLDLIGYVANDN